MPNVRAIAKRAGVSITTVSRVLNNHPAVSDAVRQRVLTISNEVGYAHEVGRRSTTNIAFVFTGEMTLGSLFDSAVLDGIQQAMKEHGDDLLVLDARRARLPHESYSQMFLRKGVRGAILRATDSSRGVCQAIANEGFPAVVVASRFDDPGIHSVDCDSRQTSREAVEHLIGLGHRRVALCMHVVDDSDHMDRLAGYREALEAHGIPFDEMLVFRVKATRDGGAQLLRRMTTAPNRPTAVYITDPLTTVGALSEARKLGVAVPEDLSILGFDDSELRFMVSPELSAVCQDAVALGREACLALHSILEPGAAPKRISKTLRTWLEIHGSTGPPSSK